MASPQEQAARALDEVPGHVWDGAALPVPVEDIAEACFGLLVCDVGPDRLARVPGAPTDGDLSGLLLVADRQIWVNSQEAEQWPGRRRFTVGHEVGHWVLHRPTASVFCRAAGVLPEERGADAAPARPDLEEEASLFAAGLMFPPRLVREHHADVGGDLGELCTRFAASRAATERAVVEALRKPLARELAGAVAFFHLDDEGYRAWRAGHGDEGFVLNDDLDVGRLHRSGCSYLARPAREGRPATRHPKWCSTDVAVLRDVLPAAPSCGRCRPLG